MNLSKKTRYKITASVLVFLFVITLFTLCSKKENVFAHAESTPVSFPTLSRAPFVPDSAVESFDTVFFGTSRALVSVGFKPDQEIDVNKTGVSLFLFDSYGGKIKSQTYSADSKLYSIFDGLSPNETYILGIAINNEAIALNDTFTFKTDKQKITNDELNKRILEKLDGFFINDNNKVLLETQACLDLIGMEIGQYGEYNSLLQSNLTRLEYSISSMDNFIDYEKIAGEPNELTLSLLKDILLTNETLLGEDIVRKFVPMPHGLTEYAKKTFDKKTDRVGGKIETNDYVMVSIAQNEEIYELYKKIPFIKTTDEFKIKYKSYSSYKKRVVSAGNKARFSEQAAEFMKEVGGPRERTVKIADTEHEITINTMVAYSYMLIDAYRETGRVFRVNSALRGYDEQAELYAERLGRQGDKSHLYRQSRVAVPGFSNHQFGLAMDFIGAEGIKEFYKEEPELYEFLKSKAADYGFYNYLAEPWHWAYLGTIF